jgi:enediyne biosynthesis protein E4
MKYIIAGFVFVYLFTACSQKSKHSLSFTNIADKAGINFENTITESDSVNLLIHQYAYMGGGVGIGDFDNDGLQDVFFSGNQVSSKLFKNNGGLKFTDITEPAGVRTNNWCTGVSVVDINNDGWQDIYVCISGRVEPERRKNLLFVNQHNLTFKEQAVEYNLADTSFSTQAVFFDYDKDGDLDMYLLNLLLKGEKNEVRGRVTNGHSWMGDILYRNEGTPAGLTHAVYSDVTKQAGIFDNGYGLGAVVSDFNNDNYPDLYITNDFYSNDILWLNKKNGTFTNTVSTSLRHMSYTSMGSDVADINNDARPDIFTLDMQPELNERKKMMFSFLTESRYKTELDDSSLPQLMHNALQLNNGVRRNGNIQEPFFSDIAKLAGVSETDWSWSVLMADFNNDGNKDIHVTNGLGRDILNADFVEYRKENTDPQSSSYDEQQKDLRKRLDALGTAPLQDYCYAGNGNLSFTDVSVSAGMPANTISNGAAYADFDNDGDLDLAVNTINCKSLLFENNLVKDTARHFISIKLQGDSLNKNALGTKVIAYSGNSKILLEQNPVRGFLSSMDYRLHFGLNKQPDSLVIYWPDNTQQIIAKPALDSFYTIAKTNTSSSNYEADTNAKLFTNITGQLGINFTHNDRYVYDYGFQPLIPQKFSQEGPFISTADLNGDGLEDFFIGAASNYAGQLFLQKPDGSFAAKSLSAAKFAEDMQSLIFDADGDKDMDILVNSGSIEFGPATTEYLPRLYINDGKANFTKDSSAIPQNIITANKAIAGADFDGDGDTDIFIGGRITAGKYPNATPSYLLQNSNGKFTDITPATFKPGLVNAASFADIDGDKKPELIIAAEWAPIRLFKNPGAQITELKTSSENITGYWRSLAVTDMDNDGDMDIIAGNIGRNNPFHISEKQPAELITLDFDNNEMPEPIFCNYIKNNKQEYKQSVSISRSQWAMQSPLIKKKFLLNRPYAAATLNEIISAEEMKRATVLTINEDRSGYFINDGKGKLSFTPFDLYAQLSPVNTIVVNENASGKKDILLHGNEYNFNVAVGRMDASYGVLLQPIANGYTAVPPAITGFIVDGDVRDMKIVHTKKGNLLLVARNNNSLMVFKY